MSERPGPLRIGIIGGGIAGLTAAIALRQAGHQPEVYERAPGPRAAGGALILWSGALRALSRLGLLKAVVTNCTTFRSYEFRKWSGEVVTTLPVEQYARRTGYPCLLIPRASLHAVLERHARDVTSVHYDRRLDDVSQSPGRVSARFSDGSERAFDVLVGADGLHSRVRSIVQGDRPLRTGRRVAWLAVVPFEHLLIQPGVALTSLGPGIGMLIAGLGNGDAYWYATVPEDANVRDRRTLAAFLGSGHEPIRELVDATPDDALITTPVRDRAPALPWNAGRITLVGDAAHPSAPDLGQGACQAIESAVCLAERLTPERPVQAALDDYERARFDRCARITALSRGALLQDALDDPLLRSAWASTLRFALPLGTPKLFEWLLGGTDEAPQSPHPG